MRIGLRPILLILAGLTLVAPASAQQSALTVPRNLQQLTDRSAVIVRGNVVSAHVEKHPELQSLDTVVVTLHVRETLKGTTGATFTFRQYLWDVRSRMYNGGYRKGQELLLMLIAPSTYGLSSPAGMQQGMFHIHRDAAGREVAVNGHANYRLFDGLGAQLATKGIVLSPASAKLVETHRRGPVALEQLTGLIREFTQEHD